MLDIIQVDGPVIRKRVNRLQLAFVGDLEHSDAVVAGRRHKQEGRSADAGEGRVESCIKQEIGIVGDVEGVDEFEGHGSLLCLEILSKRSSRTPVRPKTRPQARRYGLASTSNNRFAEGLPHPGD